VTLSKRHSGLTPWTIDAPPLFRMFAFPIRFQRFSFLIKFQLSAFQISALKMLPPVKTDYDSPWKDILETYFQPALELCFPQTGTRI